jgi:pimeloyl-ACP methyl ester carboxylesterase
VQAEDDISLAWATVGSPENPPLVKAANWLSHLELDWEAPIWSPLFRELARTFHFIRYDERGCGLSDWDVAEISFESFVSDLELVVDAAGLDRFPLLGISQGAAVSIEYAVRHPDRVSHLILFGGYAAGWRHVATPDEVREREAVMVLTETGWGRTNPSYRHLFSQTFMPSATAEELQWFDEFQRLTTSPENAVRFLDAFATIDVRDRLKDVRAPTLVIHSRDDMRIPMSSGREIAARIPDAEFVGLESRNHLLIGREPASAEFLNTVRRFLGADKTAA